MKIRLQYVLIVIIVFLLSSTANASDKKILEAVKAMEQKHGVKITGGFDLSESFKLTRQSLDNYISFGLITISPDGNTIAWCFGTLPDLDKKIPIFSLKSLKEGAQSVQVEMPIIPSCYGISNGAEVIVARALSYPLQKDNHWKLLVVERQPEIVIHDFTPYVTQIDLRNDIMSGRDLEDISVSGEGNLVALGTHEQLQVLEIPSGKTLFTDAGYLPRLSPDGKRLAFVNKDKVWIHTFADGSTVQLPIKRVRGIGGWSPDGRFLLAGAWTRLMFLALYKRQIIVDTSTGKYAVIDTLGEGDYGNSFAWVSTKLLTDNPQHQ